MTVAPVCVFAFRRPEHTRQTLAALSASPLADQTPLTVFVDGPRDDRDVEPVRQVIDIAKAQGGFANLNVIARDENAGLATSIQDGVTRMMSDHGRAIVVEDDIVTSPAFLSYMNAALTAYADCENVGSVSGYMETIPGLPESFFSRKGTSWGWASWRRVWQRVNWDGERLLRELEDLNLSYELDFGSAAGFSNMLKDQVAGRNDSWAIRFYVWNFLNGMLHLNPGESLVQNIGHDGSGTHCAKSDRYSTALAQHAPKIDMRMQVIEDMGAYETISEHLREQHGNFGEAHRRRGLVRRLAKIIRGKLA